MHESKYIVMGTGSFTANISHSGSQSTHQEDKRIAKENVELSYINEDETNGKNLFDGTPEELDDVEEEVQLRLVNIIYIFSICQGR
jgi:hypothetical protein